MALDDDEDGPPRLPGGKFYITPEGHRRLRTEHATRRAERHRVVEVVSWAAGNGDRSENADYKEGKRRLCEIDRRLRGCCTDRADGVADWADVIGLSVH